MGRRPKHDSQFGFLLGLPRNALAASAFRYLVDGAVTARYLTLLDRLSGLSPAEVEEWQVRRFLKLQRHLRKRIPAYKSAAYGTHVLSELPLLTKEKVRLDPKAYRHPRVPARRVTTGGTSGRPLVIDVAATSFFSEWAHVAFSWRTGGVLPSDRKITFRGSALGRGFSDNPVQFEAIYNQIAVSPFHLNNLTFQALLQELRDFRPRAIWGYPSAITPFANWVAKTGPHPELASLRAVLLASEGSFDWQVKLFQDVFNATVVRWYGQSEKVIFASGCPFAGGYHVLPTYGLAEVIDGRLIGSGFTNTAMPLLRYDTEDAASIRQSCPCGSPFQWLQEITGRWNQALLWGACGEPISTTALNFHDEVFAAFDRFQFRQEEAGRATLLLAGSTQGGGWDGLAEQARAMLQARVGDGLLIEVVLADAAEMLTERGKVVTVDQRFTPPPEWTSPGGR